MKIALVHEWLTNIAGSERVLLELTKIFPGAPIYTSVYDKKGTKAFNDLEIHPSFLQKLPLVKKKRELLIPLTPLAFEQFDFSKFDVVISSTHMAAKGVLTKPGTVHISYCHTPPRYLWEPHIDPRAKGGKLAWLRNRTAHSMRIWDRVAADRVDHFIANSEYVAKRINKYYGREADVIYPPVNVERFEPVPVDKVGGYYLFVSRLVNYKKCDLVIDAFNDLSLPLKIIGSGPDKSFLQKRAKQNIEFLGHLSDEQIKRYYAEARAFVFAAEEDFGIVPVEAMASGRPVIAYKGGGTTETVVEGITGTFFPEQTPQCLINTVRNFKAEKYNPDEIRQHALKFSAERFRREFKDKITKLIDR